MGNEIPQQQYGVYIGGNANGSAVTNQGNATNVQNSVFNHAEDGSTITNINGNNNTVTNTNNNTNAQPTREEQFTQAWNELKASDGWKTLTKNEQQLLKTHLNNNPWAIDELVNNARFDQVSYDPATGMLKLSQEDPGEGTADKLGRPKHACVLELDTNQYKGEKANDLNNLKVDIECYFTATDEPDAKGHTYGSVRQVVSLQNFQGKLSMNSNSKRDCTSTERITAANIGAGCNVKCEDKLDGKTYTADDENKFSLRSRFMVKLLAKDSEGNLATSTVTVPHNDLNAILIESYGTEGESATVAETRVFNSRMLQQHGHINGLDSLTVSVKTEDRGSYQKDGQTITRYRTLIKGVSGSNGTNVNKNAKVGDHIYDHRMSNSSDIGKRYNDFFEKFDKLRQ